MNPCCSFNGGFSPEMFCFPPLYLLPFGEITILLKMLFGKKKDIMCYFQGLLLNMMFISVFFFFDISEH